MELRVEARAKLPGHAVDRPLVILLQPPVALAHGVAAAQARVPEAAADEASVDAEVGAWDPAVLD
eukprot:352309-Prymnesium_polylepis.1